MNGRRIFAALLVGLFLGGYVVLQYIRQGMSDVEFLFLLGELLIILVSLNVLLLFLLRLLDFIESRLLDRKDPN